MTEQVIITVRGIQPETGGSEPIEIISVGTYRRRGETHYLAYEEADDEGHITKNRIKITDQEIQMTKTGQVATQMFFRRDAKQFACYMTPYGELMLGLTTKELRLTEEEEQIRARLLYGLEINGTHVSDCELDIEVAACAKDAGNC